MTTSSQQQRHAPFGGDHAGQCQMDQMPSASIPHLSTILVGAGKPRPMCLAMAVSTLAELGLMAALQVQQVSAVIHYRRRPPSSVLLRFGFRRQRDALWHLPA